MLGTRRSYRVLLIDDEPMIGRVLALTLERDQVETFVSARAALQRAAEADFDVVLCDLMMPEMSGMEVHRELTRHKPELARRFVLMTGSAPTSQLDTFLAAAGVPLLPKPFAEAELERCLTRCADGSAARAAS